MITTTARIGIGEGPLGVSRAFVSILQLLGYSTDKSQKAMPNLY
jgi:hypothetical protein